MLLEPVSAVDSTNVFPSKHTVCVKEELCRNHFSAETSAVVILNWVRLNEVVEFDGRERGREVAQRPVWKRLSAAIFNNESIIIRLRIYTTEELQMSRAWFDDLLCF